MKKLIFIAILLAVIAVLCLSEHAAQTPAQLVAGGQAYGGLSPMQLEQGDVYLLSLIAGSSFTAAQLSTNSAPYGGMSDIQLRSSMVFLLNNISAIGGSAFGNQTSAPVLADFTNAFGTVFITTNHIIRNVSGNLTDYWATNGGTVFSKQLAP
jgi:hypothetical protein